MGDLSIFMSAGGAPPRVSEGEFPNGVSLSVSDFPAGGVRTKHDTVSLSRNTKYEKTEGIDPVTAAIAEREGDLDLWANRFFLPSSEVRTKRRRERGRRMASDIRA